MAKAKDAFRTISEVSEWLDTPTHVLRFWESKFTQIKPVKGAGGRRYYRPEDMDLLGGIKQLLHEDGLTIKGTQKLLREKGVKHVASLGPSITAELEAREEARTPEIVAPPAPQEPKPAATSQQDPLPFDAPDDIPAFVHDTHPEPETTAPAFMRDLPDLPRDLPPMPGRLLGLCPADTTALRARAAEIAPLLSRLENLRDRMRAG